MREETVTRSSTYGGCEQGRWRNTSRAGGEPWAESNEREGGGRELRELPTGSRMGSDTIILLHVLILLFLKGYRDGGENNLG